MMPSGNMDAHASGLASISHTVFDEVFMISCCCLWLWWWMMSKITSIWGAIRGYAGIRAREAYTVVEDKNKRVKQRQQQQKQQ